MTNLCNKDVQIPIHEGKVLEANLGIPNDPKGVVLFAHGSGSSRLSPRNRFVAEELNTKGIGTLLMDLLTRDEEIEEQFTGHLRFNIELLSERLVQSTDWILNQSMVRHLPMGYFGASTGAAAALQAAVKYKDKIFAVVSRGGRPDLTGPTLSKVKAPTLLIVGACDEAVIEMNQSALDTLTAPIKELVIVPNATHLFEEPGTLEEVARLACSWFEKYISSK